MLSVLVVLGLGLVFGIWAAPGSEASKMNPLAPAFVQGDTCELVCKPLDDDVCYTGANHRDSDVRFLSVPLD